jgi:hypothetical protein
MDWPGAHLTRLDYGRVVGEMTRSDRQGKSFHLISHLTMPGHKNMQMECEWNQWEDFPTILRYEKTCLCNGPN